MPEINLPLSLKRTKSLKAYASIGRKSKQVNHILEAAENCPEIPNENALAACLIMANRIANGSEPSGWYEIVFDNSLTEFADYAKWSTPNGHVISYGPDLIRRVVASEIEKFYSVIRPSTLKKWNKAIKELVK